MLYRMLFSIFLKAEDRGQKSLSIKGAVARFLVDARPTNFYEILPTLLTHSISFLPTFLLTPTEL